MRYPKLINKDLKLNDVKFEYDCGDLWLREDVSFWDDQDYCWKEEIHPFIDANTKTKKFEWKMSYLIPRHEQIEKLNPKQEYKIEKNNTHFTYPLRFENSELFILEDIIMFPPEDLIKFINQLEGLKKINFNINSMLGGWAADAAAFDVNFDDDEYIKTTLNNPNWLTGMLHTDDKSDINDLKLIKKSIDPSIKFELNVSDKGDELEKILNKEN